MVPKVPNYGLVGRSCSPTKDPYATGYRTIVGVGRGGPLRLPQCDRSGSTSNVILSPPERWATVQRTDVGGVGRGRGWDTAPLPRAVGSEPHPHQYRTCRTPQCPGVVHEVQEVPRQPRLPYSLPDPREP